MFYLPLPLVKMKNIRKYTFSGITLFLLLSFTASIMPVDIFHEHRAKSESIGFCKTDKGQTCQHKSHLGKRANFCWICSFHVEKTFIAAGKISFSTLQPPLLKSYSIESLKLYQSAVVHHRLRGPPSLLL
jgi:hypothetical protein